MAGFRATWARWFNLAELRVQLLALWTLARHPQTPRASKWVALAVLAYALSPIDLIPDFIPVLGQLDDLVLVPLGLWLAIRLAPPALWQACLAQARAQPPRKLAKWAVGAVMVVAVWLLLAAALGWWAWRRWGAGG
jgi:uncharacterized membrane protein YkvA (DUF1232 family)